MTDPTTGSHEPGELSAYALGLLDGTEARDVERHLQGCAECRREFAALRDTAVVLDRVPPEMFLDGPPEADLVLRRTLRQMRSEKAAKRRTGRLRLVAAAAAAVVLVGGGGALVGRVIAPEPVVVAAPAGTRTVEGSADGPVGPVAMSATVTPAAGWVRLAATVRGIPEGARCTLVVISRDGTEHEAGSWLVSAAGQVDGTTVNGSTIVPPAEVLAVSVRDDGGTDYITLRA